MPIKLQSSSGGSVTLDVPVTASNYNVTVPNASGTAMVSGNMPAFSAYASVNQTSISSNTPTKVNFATEEYDTNSNFASSRFTPTVAGYYQLTYRISTGAQYGILQLFKNGSSYGVSCAVQGYGEGYDSCAVGTNLVYANGTTDYFEVYIIISSGSLQVNGSVSAGMTLASCFQGILMRAA